MGRKRKQAANYASDQPDSLEVVKKARTLQMVCGRDSVQSALTSTLKANDTSFKEGGRT